MNSKKKLKKLIAEQINKFKQLTDLSKILMNSNFDNYQQKRRDNERKLYNEYQELIGDAFTSNEQKSFQLYDKYDKGYNNDIMCLASETFIKSQKDKYKIIMSYYTDTPDDDGPYGFIRSYYKFKVKKSKDICPTCKKHE